MDCVAGDSRLMLRGGQTNPALWSPYLSPTPRVGRQAWPGTSRTSSGLVGLVHLPERLLHSGCHARLAPKLRGARAVAKLMTLLREDRFPLSFCELTFRVEVGHADLLCADKQGLLVRRFRSSPVWIASSYCFQRRPAAVVEQGAAGGALRTRGTAALLAPPRAVERTGCPGFPLKSFACRNFFSFA